MTSRFRASLCRPAHCGDDSSWAFIVLPKDASALLPRRGRTSVDASINDEVFRVLLEPDGNLSHWLKIEHEHLKAAGVDIGDCVTVEIHPLAEEPDPKVPPDLKRALAASPQALAVWKATTNIARVDWIHWLDSAKQAKTRAKRISNACEMLASGKRRVCCFDQSGYYSKALRAPTEMK